MMQLDFTGKTIIVTGATRGIGKQIADDLASLGANLILTGTRLDEIDELNNTQRVTGYRKRYLQLDFSEPSSVDNFIETIGLEKEIHGLVNVS